MKYNFIPFILLILFFGGSAGAQNLEFSSDINLEGLAYSKDNAPFWMYSNKRGRFDEKTNFSGWITGLASYEINPNAHFDFGVGVLYHDGYTDKVQLDESYFGFTNTWLNVTLGRKQKEELYHGLSATNENILWSLNARPLPGIGFKTTRPIYFWKSAGLAFTASLEEYITDDEDRYVKNTRIHHKSFHLIFDKIRNFEVKVGLQHFAEWAGTSPDYGKLPGSFRDYLDVFAGKEGSDTVGGQEANALGNHLGSYEVYITTKISRYNMQFIYNHLFEDNSGRLLRNTPDGRYGIYIENPESNQWVNALLYELYYTKNQSKNTPTTDGSDNYFNNNLYRSGWTYEHRVLGVPFITLDENRFRINNNKVLVHHLGISGVAFNRLPYKLLTSYRLNYGGKGGNYINDKVLSTYLDLKIWQEDIDVNLQLATDFSNIAAPNFGAGIKISKTLF